MVDGGFAERYDYALHALSEIRYDVWRDYDPEDTLRFYALWLHEAGLMHRCKTRGPRVDQRPSALRLRADPPRDASPRCGRAGHWQFKIADRSLSSKCETAAGRAQNQLLGHLLLG